MQINLPHNVLKIMDTLENAGYEAYAVGGCVRDSILGREPNDWDITTSAKPQQIKSLFSRTVDTGIQHGTITVLIGKDTYEVTTYRIDGEYEDSRHPKQVQFTGNLEEDLLRRDFTMNAMAYNRERGLVDLYGGLQDIKEKTIRCVGNPMERFQEDALRILRAIRFAAQFDYQIEKKTSEAISKLAENLKNISAERIQAELIKCIAGPHPEYLEEAWRLGITHFILPEFDQLMDITQNNPNHCYTVGKHTLRVLENCKQDKVIRLAALFHDFGKAECIHDQLDGTRSFPEHAAKSAKITRQIMKRLKYDTNTLTRVVKLVEYHDRIIELSPVAVRMAIHEFGISCFPDIFDLNYADIMGQSDYRREEKLAHLESLRELYSDIVSRGDCLLLKQLAINGQDLIQMGMKPGAELGDTLERLLLLVLEDPDKNSKEILKSYI